MGLSTVNLKNIHLAQNQMKMALITILLLLLQRICTTLTRSSRITNFRANRMYLILKFRLLNMRERQPKGGNRNEADRQRFRKWRKNQKGKRKKMSNLHAKNAGNPIIRYGFCYATNVMPAIMPLV